MAYSIPDDIAARVRRLPTARQEAALAYVQHLEAVGASASDSGALFRLAGSITPTDLTAMGAAIEAGCERVDAASW